MVAVPAEERISVNPEVTDPIMGSVVSLIVTVTAPFPFTDISHSFPASSSMRTSTVNGVPTSLQSTATELPQAPPTRLIWMTKSSSAVHLSMGLPGM